jgi:hypothetical protein
MWQAFQNRIQTAQQLKARNGKGSALCVLCGQEEDVEHLLFKFPLAEFVWAFASEALGWNGYPKSITELITDWLPGKFGASFQTGHSCFAGMALAIWMTRNNMCMRKAFPDKSTDVIHLGLPFVQKWKILMKELERSKVEALMASMMQHSKNFRPLDSNPSDVGFI